LIVLIFLDVLCFVSTTIKEILVTVLQHRDQQLFFASIKKGSRNAYLNAIRTPLIT